MLNRKIKILGILLIMIIFLTTMTKIVVATDYNCKISIQKDKEEIKNGETVTLLIRATDIEAGEGIATLSTVLEYDSEVFECKISGEEEWQQTSLLENALIMSRIDFTPTSTDQNIAKIELKVKEGATVGKKDFKLTRIECSTGNESFSVGDVSTSINVVDNNNNNNNNNNTDNNNTNNNNNTDNTNTNNSNNNNANTNNNNNNKENNTNKAPNKENNNSGTSGSSNTSNNNKTTTKSSSNSNNSKSVSNNSIPKTGITDVLIVCIIIALIIAIVFYIKYKRAY